MRARLAIKIHITKSFLPNQQWTAHLPLNFVIASGSSFTLKSLKKKILKLHLLNFYLLAMNHTNSSMCF